MSKKDKENTKETIINILTVGVVLLFICTSLFFLANWSHYDEAKTNCERFESYGYVTKLGKFLSIDPCKVLMEDGIWIAIKDFDISDYKEPARR